MRKTRVLMALVVTTVVLSLIVVPASAAPKAGNVVHVVQRGETLYSIARRYGMDMWALARANGIANPNCIYVGQRLVIPTSQPTGRVHVVQPGETLTQIALRYGVSAWTIARANGITNLNYIFVGQRLTIPGAKPPPSPPTKPTSYLPGSFPGPWTGEYFDNPNLDGSAYTSRSDGSINFNWAYGPPAGGMPTNHFSVRWTGAFHFDEGTYRFYARVDDGVQVYVDGERVIDGWRDGGFRLYTADRALATGDHTVQVTYYDSVQVARIHVWWKKVAGPKPTSTPESTEAWFGVFYNNEELEGPPVATQHHPWIGFEWDTGSPLPGVNADHFSARWTRVLHLKTDHYRFCAMSDDGVRIWVDGELVLDEWHPNNGIAYCGKHWVETGNHDIKVEYYEHGGEALIYVWWDPC